MTVYLIHLYCGIFRASPLILTESCTISIIFAVFALLIGCTLHLYHLLFILSLYLCIVLLLTHTLALISQTFTSLHCHQYNEDAALPGLGERLLRFTALNKTNKSTNE